jgi:cysteine-S-conjugate beta-lyase
MNFDFDHPPERRGTDSQKWQKYAGRDVLPMWVADMDFQAPPAVIEALQRRVADGVFGYARPVPSQVASVVETLSRLHGWTIEPEWIVWLPGLVVGLNVTAAATAGPGEEILCLTPVYPPFMGAPRTAGRVPVTVPLAYATATRTWEIDWDALERAVTPRTRAFFLCNPHNPVARVFRRDELEKLAEFCLRHRLVLCSDEIHCDLILDPGLQHIPTGTLGDAIAQQTITLIAPSKTYNTPGLGTALAIIPNPDLRRRFVHATHGIVAEVNVLGFTACEAAFRHCEPWRQALLERLRRNRDLVLHTIADTMPGARIEAPIEATYLAWINVTDLGLQDPIAHFEKHGVGLSEGRFFGATPGSHVRLNFGCPESTLREGLRRLHEGVTAARK